MALAPWDASAAACLWSCSKWLRRSCSDLGSVLLSGQNALFSLEHSIVGRFEILLVHGDRILACSNPLAEGHGFVTSRPCLVQSCLDHLNRLVVNGEHSSCLQLSKVLDHHFVRCPCRDICLLRCGFRLFSPLVGIVPTPSPALPLWPTPSSTWLAALDSLTSPWRPHPSRDDIEGILCGSHCCGTEPMRWTRRFFRFEKHVGVQTKFAQTLWLDPDAIKNHLGSRPGLHKAVALEPKWATDTVWQCFPHNYFVCSHMCDECMKSTDSGVCHKLWSILLWIVRACLLIIKYQVVQFLPNISISEQFWEHTCDNSPTDFVSSSLKWWSSMQGVDTLQSCWVVLFANSQYRSTHFFCITFPNIRPWRNANILRAWKLFCSSRGNSWFKHGSVIVHCIFAYLALSLSKSQVYMINKRCWLTQNDFFIEYYPHRINVLFPANLMSST